MAKDVVVGYAYKATISRRAVSVLICLFLALLISSIQPVEAVLTKCFDPSGDLRGDSPCNPNDVASACCATGWVCTNISLCVASPSVTLNAGDPVQFEGSCTDKTWDSPDCPSFCRNGNLSENAANGMWDCGNGNWCCSAFGGDTNCCERDTAVFFLGNFENTTTIGGAVGPGYSATTTSSSSLATSSSSSTSISPTTSAMTLSSPISTSTSAAQKQNTDSSSSGLAAATKAGIGVGVTAGVIAVVVFGYLIHRQRDSTKKLKQQVQMLTSGHKLDEYKDPRVELSTMAPEHQSTFNQQSHYKDVGYRDHYELSAQTELAELPAR